MLTNSPAEKNTIKAPHQPTPTPIVKVALILRGWVGRVVSISIPQRGYSALCFADLQGHREIVDTLAKLGSRPATRVASRAHTPSIAYHPSGLLLGLPPSRAGSHVGMLEMPTVPMFGSLPNSPNGMETPLSTNVHQFGSRPHPYLKGVRQAEETASSPGAGKNKAKRRKQDVF
eukprot:1191153-Prorocentrum_minimum.AAC.6